MAVHISVMSGKLKGIPAINTNTLSNKFCQMLALSGNANIVCCGNGDEPECYSWRMLTGSRKNCVDKFQQNTVTLSTDYVEWGALPVFNALWVRFHGHGELENLMHMVNFHNIARKNPKTTFGLWTKRRNIIRQYHEAYTQPDNLILIYSNPLTNVIREAVPQGFDKVFNATLHSSDLENCTGRVCTECLDCYHKGGNSVIVERVKIRN